MTHIQLARATNAMFPQASSKTSDAQLCSASQYCTACFTPSPRALAGFPALSIKVLYMVFSHTKPV